jgi:GAF domain-containing protein
MDQPIPELMSGKQLNNLFDFGQELANYTNLTEVLVALVDKATSLFGADWVYVSTFDSWGRSEDKLISKSVGCGSSADILASWLGDLESGFGCPLFLSDGVAEYHGWSQEIKSFLLEIGCHSLAVLPIEKAKGRVWLGFRDTFQYSEGQKKLLVWMANQATLGLANVRNLERERKTREQAEILQSVSLAISRSVNLKDVAEKILVGIKKVVDYHKAAMQLIQGDQRTPLAYRGLDYTTLDTNLYRPISQDGLIQRVLLSGRPFILPDVLQDKDWELCSSTDNVKSWVGIPLFFNEKPVGLITLDHSQKGFYSEENSNALEAFASQAAVAVGNTLLLEEKEHRVRDLKMLNDFAQVMSSELRTEKLFKVITEQIRSRLDCTHCVIFMKVIENNEVILRPFYITSDQEVKIAERTFREGQGLAGWVLVHGKGLVLPDARRDKRYAPARANRGEPRSMLLAPIQVGGRTIGVISADQDKYAWFSENDLNLVNALARQVGIAYQRNQGLELLEEVGVKINQALDVKKIMEEIVAGALQLTHMSSGIIFLLSEDGRHLLAQYQYPPEFKHAAPRLENEQGYTRRVFKNKRAIWCRNIQKDEAVNPAVRAFTRSMAAVPLIHKDQVLGVLFLNDINFHHFSQTEKSLLTSLSNQAAIALVKTRLFEQQDREQKALKEISDRLKTLDQKELLMSIVDIALNLTQTELGTIYLISEDKQQIVDFVSRNRLTPQIEIRETGHDDGNKTQSEFSPARKKLSSEGITQEIINLGRWVIVPDTSKDTRVSKQILDLGIRAFIGLPIKYNQQVLGVLYLDDKEQILFSEEDYNLLDMLVSQAAVAIQYMRQYQQRSQALETIQRLVNYFSKVGEQVNLLTVILQDVVELFKNVDFVSYALVDQVAERLVFQAVWEQGTLKVGLEVPEALRYRKVGVGIMGEAASRGQIRRIGNVQSDSHYVMTHPLTMSQMAIPLLDFNQQVIGLLNLESNQVDAFGDDNEAMGLALANVAAIAIQKERMYWDLQRRAVYIDALSRVAIRASALPDRLDIFSMVVREAKQTLNATRCSLFTLNNNNQLTPLAFEGFNKDVADTLAFYPGEGLAGWVMQAGHSFKTADANAESSFVPDDLVQPGVTRPMLLAPVWMEGRVIGVLSADRDGGETFDELDQRFLETLAIQAGIFTHEDDLRKRKENAIQRRFNPYVMGGPIRLPDGFFGRQDLIENILSGVHNNNFIIHGERRIGKTSLLFQLDYHLNHLSIGEEKFYFLPVMVNLQGVPEEAFFAHLGRQLKLAAMLVPEAGQERTYNAIHLEKDIRQVVWTLKDHHPNAKIRIIFLIDEMDQFVNYSQSTQERFRSVLVGQICEFIKIILAGVSINWIHSHTSPWYNIFLSEELRPLSEAEAWELVTAPVADCYTFETAAVNLILQASDLKPLDVQRLASYSLSAMFDRLNQTEHLSSPVDLATTFIKSEDVEQAIHKILNLKQEEYHHFWSELNERQRQVVRTICEGDGLLLAENKPAPKELDFPREKLYYVTHMAEREIQFSYLFQKWIKEGAA